MFADRHNKEIRYGILCRHCRSAVRHFSVLIKWEKGTFLMCVVFLCITVTHGNDESPLAFGVARILDTTIGIVIALIINRFPIRMGIKPPYTE